MNLIETFCNRKKIHPPDWLRTNLHYLCYMGSHAYGLASEESDNDIYGWCIPPKRIVFPWTAGVIKGFGFQGEQFNQWQENHIQDEQQKKEYDFSIYNIVRYFQLCSENNPNMIDSLFVNPVYVLHCTSIGNLVRDNRQLFLSKRAYHTFKGYAFSQMHKIDSKNPIGKRKELVDKYGYDVKFGYHLIRLLNECHQILERGDLNLEENNEELKSIRRGDWPENRLKEEFTKRMSSLESLYSTSSLRYAVNEDELKSLLLMCLENHYGSISECIKSESKYEQAIRQLKEIIERV